MPDERPDILKSDILKSRISSGTTEDELLEIFRNLSPEVRNRLTNALAEHIFNQNHHSRIIAQIRDIK